MSNTSPNSQLGWSGKCERENTDTIVAFMNDEIQNTLPPEAVRQAEKVSLSICCGGVALDGSGCKTECVPFIVAQVYGKDDRHIAEVTYFGNCSPSSGNNLL